MPLPVIFLFLCLSVLRGQQVVALPESRGKLARTVIAHGFGHGGNAQLRLAQQLRRLFHAVLFHVRGYRLPVHCLENILERRRVHKVFVRKLLDGDALLRVGKQLIVHAPRRLHLLYREALDALSRSLALAAARFRAGVTGENLDILARGPLWDEGLDYNHGTGHGVGFVLSVHEGPVHISPRAPQSPEARVVPGLVLSNEPGLYRPGLWGIRTENLVTPVAADPEADEMQAFLHFETLTLCPIDYRLVKTAMMTPYEIWWVNDYHRRVREVLENRVSPRAHKWLMRATDII